jgi:hypothetical protein
LINGVRVRDCRSLRGRKSDQCHSREGLFLVSHFFGIYPFCVAGWRTRRGFICKAIGAKKDVLYRDGCNMCGSCDRLLQNLVVSLMTGKGKHYRACSGRRTGTTCGSCCSADLASLTTSTGRRPYCADVAVFDGFWQCQFRASRFNPSMICLASFLFGHLGFYVSGRRRGAS